jgi:molecular chaperone GrpE
MAKDDEKIQDKEQDPAKDPDRKAVESGNSGNLPPEGNADEKPDYRGLLSRMEDEEIAALFEKSRQASVYLDLLQRTRADYENYQKRVDRERADVVKYAGQPLLGRLVGIAEVLSRALASTPEAQVEPNFLQGIQLVQKDLDKLLADFHVTAIEALGRRFDPLYHQAVMMRSLEEQPDMSVIQEFEKGYMFHDRVLCASKVVVNRRPAPKKEEPKKEEPDAAAAEPQKRAEDKGTQQKGADTNEASS